MLKCVGRFLREEDGTETVEWGVMAGLIVVALIGVVYSIGQWVLTKMTALDDGLANPSGAPPVP